MECLHAASAMPNKAHLNNADGLANCHLVALADKHRLTRRWLPVQSACHWRDHLNTLPTTAVGAGRRGWRLRRSRRCCGRRCRWCWGWCGRRCGCCCCCTPLGACVGELPLLHAIRHQTAQERSENGQSPRQQASCDLGIRVCRGLQRHVKAQAAERTGGSLHNNGLLGLQRFLLLD